MKRILALLILPCLLLAFFACDKSPSNNLTCQEIIKAYEDAGYSNIFHRHGDKDVQMSGGEECYIIIHESDDDDSDLIQIKIFTTEEEAIEAAEFDKYNVVRWMIAVMFGEWRWLKSDHYGKIEYSSYNSELIEPLKQLIK